MSVTLTSRMQITSHVATLLCAALEWPAQRSAEFEGLFAPTPDPSLGDIALPCFQLARELRSAPAQIARTLAEKIRPDTLVAAVAAQGPYLNFRLDRPAAAGLVLRQVLENPGTYGRSDLGQGRTLVLDFSAPNIAKPFHFGHLRSTNIGADLARIFEFQGWRVIRRNYIGDWGTQFGFVLHAWREWGNEAELKARAIDYLVELYVKAYKASETDAGIRDHARQLFVRLEQGDPEIRQLWERFRALSLEGFTRTYQRLGIRFDSFEGESAINPKVPAVIERFRAAGVAVESQGALVVEVSEVLGREIVPLMLRKSDGASTYAARDCAEAIDRWDRYRFGANIYIVSRQEDHFAQVFAALGRLAKAEGWETDWPALCENVSFGFVRGMSTRKGEAVWLEHVLDEAAVQAQAVRSARADANPRGFPQLPPAELAAISESVGQAALLYFDVSSRRLTDITFDWNTVLQFEGNTGPYLQYSHARMSGIFRKAADLGLAPATAAGAMQRLGAAEEWALVLALRDFPGSAQRAAAHREPFEVAQYLHGLASTFNTFYNSQVVVDPADGELSSARLALVAATREVLRTGLGLLGIRPLEFM
jgi:arginyl-tRNA synthetase